MKRITLLATILLMALPFKAAADEGMWLIQDINEALEKKMKERGLKLSAGEIYNADAPGASVSDAIVSLGFYCTGSVISDKGLIITNHHCAYANIAKLSTPEHNYLEDGFWAMHMNQEIPIEGEEVFFLKKVIDVTSDVKAMKKEYAAKGEQIGSRKLSFLIEKKYTEKDGLTPIFSSSYAGEKCYVSFYKVYNDLRLVAAPPTCIGYFGGDGDNWQWPRQNCDFAIYRIYENGKPVTREKSLKISLKGYEPGSFSMVIGYPGRTDRYASSAEIAFQKDYNLPVSNGLRSPQMDILRKWIESDADVRMKYSDHFFNLSNTQLNNVGMEHCYRRFRVVDEKKRQEEQMQKWIDGDEKLTSMWGTLIPDLKEAYSETNKIEKDKAIFRETLFRGNYIIRYLLRANNCKELDKAKEILKEGIAATDPRVEKELIEHAAREFFTNLDGYYYGKWQQKLQDRFDTDYKAMAEYLWEKSNVSSIEKVESLTSMDQVKNDPLKEFLMDSPVTRFNERSGHGKKIARANDLEREYKRALYWMRFKNGELQYPDANSTMRITYGRVSGYEPNDGVICNWYTTPKGILEKYDPNTHDYNLNARQKSLLEKGKWGRWGFSQFGSENMMIVDFLSDNDITGGNSGSPVLNDKGEIIGLAFDGNIESLASDASFTVGYNMCINTDIRFVMWVLDKYAGMKRIIKELDFV